MTKKEQIIEMRSKGMTFQAIADEFGCSRQNIHLMITREPKNGKKISKKVSEKVRIYFKENKIGLCEFCKKFGKDEQRVRYILGGRSNSLKTIKMILKELNMTFEDVFGGTDSEY